MKRSYLFILLAIVIVSMILNSGCSTASNSNNGGTQGGTVLPAPGSIQSSNVTEISVDLTWSTVSGAYGYLVYYSETENGTYSQIWGAISASCTVNYLVPGKNYYFKIKAAKYDAGNNLIYGDYSGAILVTTKNPSLGGIQNVKISASSYNINITYDNLSGSNDYIIFKSNNGVFDYSKYSDFGSTTYEEDNNNMVEPNTTYYYRILAINTNTKQASALYDVNATTKPSTLILPNFTTIAKSYKIELDWNAAVTGATNYNTVSKKDESIYWNSSSYCSSSSLFYSDENVELNSTYNVQFRAINVTTGASSPIYKCNITTGNNCTLIAPTGITGSYNNSTKNIDLTWNKSLNAEGYKIYITTNLSQDFGYCESSNTNSCSMSMSASSGTTFYFKVKSVNKTNDNTSPLSSDYTTVVYP
jgi:hypothetical protein